MAGWWGNPAPPRSLRAVLAAGALIKRPQWRIICAYPAQWASHKAGAARRLLVVRDRVPDAMHRARAAAIATPAGGGEHGGLRGATH